MKKSKTDSYQSDANKREKTFDKVKHLNNVIDHFTKLLNCERLVVTGSYALYRYGLLDTIKDLDIIIMKPDSASLQLLEDMRIENKTDYPDSKMHIRVNTLDVDIDFFIFDNVWGESLLLDNGMYLQTPREIAIAKRQFSSLKQVLQLKKISKIFYNKTLLKDQLQKIQDKL